MVLADAILLAAGSGTRYQREHPKQFDVIAGQPVFMHALRSLMKLKGVRHVIGVFPKDYINDAEKIIEDALGPNHPVRLVIGGATRPESSRLAIAAIAQMSPAPERVLIHDASRPYFSKAFHSRVQKTFGAWIPVIPVSDTLKRVEDSQVQETVDRNELYRAQTPQIFDFSVLQSLWSQVGELSHFTDDASLCEQFKVPVGTFEGDLSNIKLTYPVEAEMLRPLLNQATDKEACESESDTTYTV